jgi:histidinol-phosphatase (PHP family)
MRRVAGNSKHIVAFAPSGYIHGVNISSFHTHTRLCKHASGVPSDYVRRAASDGCSALGFSDHVPYPDDSVWRESRMSISEIPLYFQMVADAREEAKQLNPGNPIPVYCGFECEWHPIYDSWYRELRANPSVQYLAYGPHWVDDEGDFWYIPERSDARLLTRYINLVLNGMRSGLFSFVAHPDLFLSCYSETDPDVRAACADLIAAAIDLDLPLEINGLGLVKTRVPGAHGMRPPYPVPEFWQMAAEAGAKIICCSDAHRPEDALAGAFKARSFAEKWGITALDPLEALSFTATSK